MLNKLPAIVLICAALAGCANLAKQCNNPASLTNTKVVPIIGGDFGIVGQDISAGIGDVCAVNNLFVSSSTTTTTTTTTVPAATGAPATGSQ